jgi:hypothetical protein
MNVNVHRKKLRLGLLYGVLAGAAFAIFAWGTDAWLLAQAHSAYYYVKFIPGLVICVGAGGLAGWLTISVQKHSFAILFWGIVAGLYTWLAVWLPFSGSALLIKSLNPSLDKFLKFSKVENLSQFILLTLLFIGLAAIICGLLEINLIDSAALSTYFSGTLVAVLVCTILFGLAGSGTDHMINTPLREPVQVVNNLLQFAQDNYGVEVSKATARAMHLSSARQLGDLVQKPRQLTLVGFDAGLLTVDVLVDFAGTWAKCTTIYSQPTDCLILPLNP